MYYISVLDWSVRVEFNDYAYLNARDSVEFEESIYMVLGGQLISTRSKKCKKNMATRVAIHSQEHWPSRTDSNKELRAIGSFTLMKADPEIYPEDTLTSWVMVPPKSYVNIQNYLTYKGKAKITIMGTDLFYRNGDIFYFRFEKLSSSM